MPTSNRVRVSGRALDFVRAACEVEYPDEACGLLVGPPGEGHVTEALAVRNACTGARTAAFEMDPSDVARRGLEARDRGLDLLGTWHSHPEAGAVPSSADRAAAQAGWANVIVPVRRVDGVARAGQPRCWRLANGAMIEQDLEIA